jgi:hypothetical protein
MLLIALAVLAGNVIYVTGLADNSPISWTSNIAHLVCRLSCGPNAIDPNVGFITQPLGHLSAMDLLHGHLPWWNYFEGLGQPLAGEMQAASLFPLTLLFGLPSGLLWFHVSLEMTAGASTYLLAKRLPVPFAVAVGGAVLFALNGTFAWIGNAVLNPVAFLPMLVLGIEVIFDSARVGARKGWYLAAIALALSIYAGFPEVALLDGLFCLGWASVRLFSLPKALRRIAALRVGLAGLVGTLISLPILVPFDDFLKVAFIGQHQADQFAQVNITTHALATLLDPYVAGTIIAGPSALNSVAGYFTASVTALGLLGMFGTRLRALRIFLGAWTVAGLLGALDTLHLRAVWNLIPFMDKVDFSRYIWPSCELSLIVLAVLGITDLANNRRSKPVLAGTLLATLGLLAWGAVAVRPLAGVAADSPVHRLLVELNWIPFLAVAALLIVTWLPNAKVTSILVVSILVGESLLMFVAPTLRSPTQITVDQAPIAYLQEHEGQERYVSLGVLYPNWGSQYGLNALNAIDLPFPNTFAKFIAAQLAPDLAHEGQFITPRSTAGQEEIANNFVAYEDASVKFLVLPSSTGLLAALTKLGVTRVFKDSSVAIYQMPDPRPFYSATSKSCAVTSSNVASAQVSCTGEGSTIVRTELAMAGWHAFVNGQAVAVRVSDGVYQSITVPAGNSTVTFDFVPPHEQYALLAALLAALFLLGSWARDRLGFWRPKRASPPREEETRSEEDQPDAGSSRPSSENATPEVATETTAPRSPFPRMPRPRTS